MIMAQPSERGAGPLTVGVIGLGGMGVQHCRTIARQIPEMKLVAVCDADGTQARTFGQEMGVAAFTSHKQLIDSGLCRATIVATPHPFHAPIAVDCFAAGLHVLSEKPLAETISAGDRMAQAARDAKRVLGVMFQMRFMPSCHKAIEIVRRGELGRLIRASLTAPNYRSQAYYDAGKWRATWVGEGGGVLLNQSPHIVDLFLALTGLPVWVQGITGAMMHDIEVEDCAQALLRFRDGGFGYLYCSTLEPGPGEAIEVFAENGKLVYRDGQVKYYRFARPVSDFTKNNTEMWGRLDCKEVPLDVREAPTGHADVMRNFARHILHGEDLLCDGESGLAQLELANAIIYSGRTGRAVDLPLDRAAYDALLGELRRTSRYNQKSDQIKRITDPSFVK
jgi:predicted dehydrogenase